MPSRLNTLSSVAPSGSAALIWRIAFAADQEPKPQIWAGVEYYDGLHRAAPELMKDARQALAGQRVVTYSSPTCRYICSFCPADGPRSFLQEVVVATTIEPIQQALEINRLLCMPGAEPLVSDDTAQLVGLLQHAPAAIALLHLVDGKLCYHFTNDAFDRFAGRKPVRGQILGTLPVESVGNTAGLQQRMYEAMKTNRGFEAKHTRLRLAMSGRIATQDAYFDVRFEPLVDHMGHCTGLSLFAYDVTAQAIEHIEAQQQEAHFRHLADSMPQIVWTADHTGHVAWFNERWYKFKGTTRGEIGAEDWRSLLHPDEQDAISRQWQSAITSFEPFNIEARFKNEHGHYKWFLVQILPIEDSLTNQVRWFGSATDIHEQKRISQKLSNLLDNITEGFYVIDHDWHITRVNKQHTLLTGVPKEQQIGKDVRDLFFSGPDINNTVYLQHFMRAKNERISIHFDEHYAPLDMWTNVSLYPTGEEGLAVIYRNLSPEMALQKNIEVEKHKFEAVFVDSPACMALLKGPSLVFEKANPKYIELMGSRQLLGKPLDEALPELADQPFAKLMTRVLETGEPFVAKAMAADLISKPGGTPQRHYFDFTYTRVLDGANKPYGVYLHATDITDKVAAQSRADELALSLRDAIQARDEFLSSASHELKTPVTSIKMQLQMTRRKVRPELGVVPDAHKLAKTLDTCNSQIDRLTALIDDLLDVSRIASGKMTFNFAPVDMGVLTHNVINQYADQFEAAGCAVSLRIDDQVSVTCDGFRIEQVVVNLFTNAIKYARSSAIDVYVQHRGSLGIRLQVADKGMGISQVHQERIFDRFERAISHNSVSGLGLGLFICKQIVEAHKGTISVASEVGHGTVFTVDLPADPAA